ncbi:hypothetical protein [Winogradskyella schleiferi]|uniref:hypothetical protein n=1 Tax=Winogradskyella schleiferi TaxID=2686078 RepID=UPI0015B822CD|nr:hypothetical protein [Winogradskyella schleiferi]
MKIKVLNYIFCGIFTLNLASCGNKNESNSDNGISSKTEYQSDKKTETQLGFVYSNTNKKVEIVLENDAEFLVVGEPTRANFETENINNQRFMIVGPGIMVNQADKDGFRFTITPIENTLVDGKLEIRVTERVENGEDFTHKFLIPVKSKAN